MIALRDFPTLKQLVKKDLAVHNHPKLQKTIEYAEIWLRRLICEQLFLISKYRKNKIYIPSIIIRIKLDFIRKYVYNYYTKKILMKKYHNYY